MDKAYDYEAFNQRYEIQVDRYSEEIFIPQQDPAKNEYILNTLYGQAHLFILRDKEEDDDEIFSLSTMEDEEHCDYEEMSYALVRLWEATNQDHENFVYEVCRAVDGYTSPSILINKFVTHAKDLEDNNE